MAVNITEVSSVYNSLLGTMTVKYDAMWSANEIDAETYAQLVGQASSQLIQLAMDTVQKQEQLDKDNALKEVQIINEGKRGLILDEDRIKVQEEVDLLQSQEAKVAYETANVLPAQVEKIAEDILVAKQEVEIAKTKSATEKANSIANIDKVLGYVVNTDVDGNIVVGDSTGDGKLDAERSLMIEKVDTEVLSQGALKAKVADENGRVVDDNGNLTIASDPDTQHYHLIQKLEADVTNAGEEGKLLVAKTTMTNAEESHLEAKTLRDYGVNSSSTNMTDTIAVGDVPLSQWAADMLKAQKEIDIAEKTSEGFLNDMWYKKAKISQETIFALANAGVITEDKVDTATDTPDGTGETLQNPYQKFAQILDTSLASMTTTTSG